jgi:hypothetical protein
MEGMATKSDHKVAMPTSEKSTLERKLGVQGFLLAKSILRMIFLVFRTNQVGFSKKPAISLFDCGEIPAINKQ